MLNINLRAVLSRMVTGPLVILASLLLVAVAVACSDGTPTEAPGASSPPSETAVAYPATPEPPAATVPATAVLPPTGTTEPPTPNLPAVTPVPTDTPLSEPAVAATAEPTPPPLALYVSEEHEAASEKVYDLVTELVEELGHREAGTPEELQAAEHLKERLDAMGYSAELQSFTLEFFDVQRYIQTRGENAQIIVESPIQAPVSRADSVHHTQGRTRNRHRHCGGGGGPGRGPDRENCALAPGRPRGEQSCCPSVLAGEGQHRSRRWSICSCHYREHYRHGAIRAVVWGTSPDSGLDPPSAPDWRTALCNGAILGGDPVGKYRNPGTRIPECGRRIGRRRRRAGHCRRTLRRRSANGGRGQRQHLRHRRRLGVGRSTGQ